MLLLTKETASLRLDAARRLQALDGSETLSHCFGKKTNVHKLGTMWLPSASQLVCVCPNKVLWFFPASATP